MPGGSRGPLVRLLGQATYGSPKVLQPHSPQDRERLWELQLHWLGQDRSGDKQNRPAMD